jgi:hypothetical protein
LGPVLDSLRDIGVHLEYVSSTIDKRIILLSGVDEFREEYSTGEDWHSMVFIREEHWGLDQGDNYEQKYTQLHITDPRIRPQHSRLAIELVRVRKFPLVGTVTSGRWVGRDLDTGLLATLNGDPTLSALFAWKTVRIRTDSAAARWVIVADGWTPVSRPVWRALVAVARHLTRAHLRIGL